MNDIKVYTPGLNALTRGKVKQEFEKNLSKLLREECYILPTQSVITNSKLHLIPVTSDKKIGFIDHMGKIVIDMLYDEVKGSFQSENGFVAVKKDRKWGVIDASGNVVLPILYSFIWLGKDCPLVTLQDSKGWQVMDVVSKQVIIPNGIFDLIEGFHFGFARIKKGDLWGVVYKDGTVVIEPQYTTLYDFYDNWDLPTTKVKRQESDTPCLIDLNQALNKVKKD